jgi:branched-chain amino acid aminotransferase
MNFVSFNGKLIPASEPVFPAANRSYRYGDGLFETVKVRDGKLLLEAFHFERLFDGLSLLDYNIPKHFTTSQIGQEILDLCQKNGCEKSARVRLSVSRGEGGLYDDTGSFHYLVECWPLVNMVDKLNDEGLIIDVFPDSRKACDKFSHLKSANFLPYVMAARFARQQKLDDALVLNQHGRIADATIANLFIIKNHTLVTPPLSEGGVDGVMRKWLKVKGSRFRIEEAPLSIEDLETADELFLTNAIAGIRWVKQFRDKTYSNRQTVEIYKALIQTI